MRTENRGHDGDARVLLGLVGLANAQLLQRRQTDGLVGHFDSVMLSVSVGEERRRRGAGVDRETIGVAVGGVRYGARIEPGGFPLPCSGPVWSSLTAIRRVPCAPAGFPFAAQGPRWGMKDFGIT